MKTVKFTISDVEPVAIFGLNDQNLRRIEERFSSRIVVRGGEVTIKGEEEEVEKIRLLLLDLADQAGRGHFCTQDDVRYSLERIKKGGGSPLEPQPLLVSSNLEGIRPRTLGQRGYIEAMAKNDIVFSIGPAGTGKTYLAVAMAISSLKERLVKRIVLVRPAVEAGESLGFLPGDFKEKVDPYLRPLYDALYDMLPSQKMRKSIENGVIEIAPLAYMRGRNLKRAFVILDEAQNTTIAQMKMFLTRLGPHSRAVITGDITQIDLSNPSSSGLILIQSILKDVEGIKFVYLTESDVVRHRLVQEIIKAFDHYETSK